MKAQPNHPQAPQRLEDFVAAHRDEFDQDLPSPKLWEQISSQVPALDKSSAAPAPQLKPEAKIRQLYPSLRRLAVACMLLLIGLLVGLLVAEKRVAGYQQSVVDDQRDQIRQLEEQYRHQIEQRLAEVARYDPDPILQQELSSMVESDFRREVAYQEGGNLIDQQLLKAMATEYQAKLDALERVIHRLRASSPTIPIDTAERTPIKL